MPAAVLAEEISRASILLGVLVRRQQIERCDDLAAYRRDRVVRNDEDKVVAADVPDESVFAAGALHDVVEELGENADHPVAFVVTVAVVEFLEMVQVGVADGEGVAERKTAPDLPLDRRRSRQAG